MSNKRSHLYEQCKEINHREEYLGSFKSIGDIKWMRDNVVNINGETFDEIEKDLKNDPNRFYNTKGDLTGTITIIVYDEETDLFDWYHHIPNTDYTQYSTIQRLGSDGFRVV